VGESMNLIQGTVDVMILKTLVSGAKHGFAISKAIKERSEGVLGLEDAALYQALHRIENKGWLTSTWGLSENNRRAKYYALTAIGRKQLAREMKAWAKYSRAVSQILDPAGEV